MPPCPPLQPSPDVRNDQTSSDSRPFQVFSASKQHAIKRNDAEDLWTRNGSNNAHLSDADTFFPFSILFSTFSGVVITSLVFTGVVLGQPTLPCMEGVEDNRTCPLFGLWVFLDRLCGKAMHPASFLCNCVGDGPPHLPEREEGGSVDDTFFFNSWERGVQNNWEFLGSFCVCVYAEGKGQPSGEERSRLCCPLLMFFPIVRVMLYCFFFLCRGHSQLGLSRRCPLFWFCGSIKVMRASTSSRLGVRFRVSLNDGDFNMWYGW